MPSDEISTLAWHCEQELNLGQVTLGDDYFYQSLPLCAIDAVFCRLAPDERGKAAVLQYCQYFSLTRVRADRVRLPAIEEQESLAGFAGKVLELGVNEFINKVFRSREMISGTPMTKAEGSYLFALMLKKYGANFLQDAPALAANREFEEELTHIPGLDSRGMLRRFFLLSVDDGFVWPDQQAAKFVSDRIHRRVGLGEAGQMLRSSVDILRQKQPHITARLLDKALWDFGSVKR
jgi:hypothetical protein